MTTSQVRYGREELDAGRELRMFIGGSWVAAESGEMLGSIDPCSGREWVHAPSADAADVDAAVEAAASAMSGEWGRVSGSMRGRLLARLADLVERDGERLASIESMDNGKLIRETRAVMSQVPVWLRYYSGLADKLAGETLPVEDPTMLVYTVREPVGVVAAIVPWNNPIMIMVMKVAPALAAGCAVVIKTADQTPASTLAFAELVEEAGFPAGAFNVLTGPGLPAGSALARHPKVNKVSFTGSTAVGSSVMKDAADHVAEVTLELGGKSPNIVFADADLGAAANGVIAGVFASSGQMCIAGGRLLVERSVHDELVARLKERVERIVLGDQMDPLTEMGPLVSAVQLARVQDLTDSAVREGATLVTGGGRASGSGLDEGYFFRPTIFSDVTPDMRLARDEVFGPVLVVIPFDTEDEALTLANDTIFGLASGVWTKDIQRGHRMARGIRAGVVWLNCYRNTSPHVPFGGVGQSGFGRENGAAAVLDFTHVKSVWVDTAGISRDPFSIPPAPSK
ncbi:unannotated protein [freshwater metagenome]|uniref:Unannotated protein n=1 Tax=freshwater metagenome TaxID=449393 RepID=A0A6J7IHB9_9ZZZZ